MALSPMKFLAVLGSKLVGRVESPPLKMRFLGADGIITCPYK